MEFLTVGNSKIKIMLSCEEALARGIKADNVSYDDPEIRRSFRKILDEAKEKAGFDIGREKVLIQLYPSKDGGMELFVTKLGVISKETVGMISKSERVAVISTKKVYYIFETLETLISAARCTPPELVDDSTVWRLEDGTYCLAFCEREHKYVLSKLSRLSEFGRKINDTVALGLSEHATLLSAGDAIEVFSRM